MASTWLSDHRGIPSAPLYRQLQLYGALQMPISYHFIYLQPSCLWQKLLFVFCVLTYCKFANPTYQFHRIDLHLLYDSMAHYNSKTRYTPEGRRARCTGAVTRCSHAGRLAELTRMSGREYIWLYPQACFNSLSSGKRQIHINRSFCDVLPMDRNRLRIFRMAKTGLPSGYTLKQSGCKNTNWYVT